MQLSHKLTGLQKGLAVIVRAYLQKDGQKTKQSVPLAKKCDLTSMKKTSKMYLLIYFTRLPILYFNINIITCKKEANSSTSGLL